MRFGVRLLEIGRFKRRETVVVLLPWVCSRCCECFAFFSSSVELWGAQGLGDTRLWVLGPGTVWKG